MKDHPQSKSEEILVKAAGLFRSQGFAATSIRDLGDAMGTTSAALYYHFKNKEELLEGVITIGLQRVMDEVLCAVAQEVDAYTKLKLAMRAHLKVSLANQDFAVVVLQGVRDLSPKKAKPIQKLRQQYETIWDDIFRAGEQGGIFKPGLDHALLRKLIFGAMNNVVFWYREGGDHSVEEISDTFLELMSSGILPENLEVES